MSKNLFWKLFFIVFLTGMCLLSMFTFSPFGLNLKGGLDITGGTSVQYQIDTKGMSKNQRSQVAEQMIRILKQRIDPSNKLNLVWRAQGNDRIEIQMPMASADTRRLRQSYQEKLDELTQYNVSIREVGALLERPQSEWDDIFVDMAVGSEDRLIALKTLGTARDSYNKGRENRTALITAVEKNKIELEKVVTEQQMPQVERLILDEGWDTLDDPNKVKRLERITTVGKDAAKQTKVRDYVTSGKQANKARVAVIGQKLAEKDAWTELRKGNINIDRFVRYLNATPAKLKEEVGVMKEKYPQATKKIDEIVKAYKAYSKVSGKLDDPEDLKRRLKGSGVLEFRIVPDISDVSQADIADYNERLQELGPVKASDQGDTGYVWRKIRSKEDFKASGIVRATYGEDDYVLLYNTPEETLKHEMGNNTWSLTNARGSVDSLGAPAVAFSFNMIGSVRFLELTKNNLQKPLCILLDEEAISAPNINSAISGSGIITGKFTGKEVQDLADKLNAGSLPARLSDEPISTNTVGPTVGKNNLTAGKNAGIYGLIAVVIFMVCYYMVPGSLAGIALAMNMILIIGFMAFTRATFTLPGIAALILTIGMAVDANVLIFERIREEQARGSSLRIALQNGYSRAFRTILDANLTTFIVAMILWILATEEIKGFALMLMIGIGSSMFTALFVTHVIFDLLLDLNILKDKLTMVNLIGRPKFNWMSKRMTFRIVSAVLVVGCITNYVIRHNNDSNSIYSIEFTGGTDVHVMLTDEGADDLLKETGKQDLREAVEYVVRQKGTEKKIPAIASVSVQQIGEKENLEFSIITTATNLELATITLGETKITAEALEDAIHAAANEIGDERLKTAKVTKGEVENTLVMETDQLNLNLINDVLAIALPKDAKETTFETDSIVTDAVGEALVGKLRAKMSLEPNPANIISKPIDDSLIESKPYLEGLKGGVWISCNFGTNKVATLNQLKERFEDARFRSDFEQYTYHTPNLFVPGGKQLSDEKAETEMLTGIELAAVSQDVIYGASSDAEWDGFVNNERGRFTDTLELSTTFERLSQIDPSIGHQSKNQALIAIVFSLLAIIGYIWIRFGDLRFGLAAVMALVHDVSIAMGMVAASYWLSGTAIGKALLISDFKIDLPMIAGFLTVIGYSLNDTIVVFDRIRENRGKLATLSATVIDSSINQTISRTLITSLTTLMVLLVMYIWGGPNLRGFNYVLIVGVIVGTYSSIGIAAPMLYGAKVEEPKPVEPVGTEEGVSIN